MIKNIGVKQNEQKSPKHRQLDQYADWFQIQFA